MNDRLNTQLGHIRQLEAETQKKESDFCTQIHARKSRLTEASMIGHRRLQVGWRSYLLQSRFLVLLTSPIIWMCVVPIALADLVAFIYQAICFPIYGIPKVRRSEYLAFDRHHLAYLNFIEKLNCEYCAYVNGVLAYFTEIAARTEQHWCPIKHAGCVKCAHSRYKKFVDFGDAEGYRQRNEEIRRSYADIGRGADAK